MVLEYDRFTCSYTQVFDSVVVASGSVVTHGNIVAANRWIAGRHRHALRQQVTEVIVLLQAQTAVDFGS